jgi:quercetin dioxygenase-like cupin family protein
MDRRHFTRMVAVGLAASAAPVGVTAAQTAPAGFVTPSGQGRFGEQTALFGGSSPNDIKVSGRDTAGQLAVFEYVGRVRGGPPLHVHPDQDEMFFIHEGEYLFQVGDARHRIGAGDTIFLPRAVPHTFAQVSGEGRMLFAFTPAGDMEDYFRALAALAGPPSVEEETALFARYGMRRLGPGLEVGEGG